MKRVVLFLLVSIVCSAYPVMSQDPPSLMPAYLTAGAGFDSGASQGTQFGWLAYAKKTGLNNGLGGLPIYSYTELRAFSFQAFKAAVTGSETTSLQESLNLTTGVLFPFYAKKLAGFDVVLAIDGNIGYSQVVPDSKYGYTVGAKVVAKITRGSGKWNVIISSDPSKSSVSGVHATQASIGFGYGFNGF